MLNLSKSADGTNSDGQASNRDDDEDDDDERLSEPNDPDDKEPDGEFGSSLTVTLRIGFTQLADRLGMALRPRSLNKFQRRQENFIFACPVVAFHNLFD